MDGVPWCLSFLEPLTKLLNPWLDRDKEALLTGTGLLKRTSLVVVFGNIKVFLRPNGVIISLRQRSVAERAEEALLIGTGLQEAHSLFLRSFDFRPSIAFESTTFKKNLFVDYLIRGWTAWKKLS